MASIVSSPAVASVNRASPSLAAPFNGLKSAAAFPVTRKTNNDITSIASNGGRVQCMKVWPPIGLKKNETLSYLPPLTEAQLIKQVDYLIKKKLIPCIEFTVKDFHVHREHHHSPGYYDGRYWTMWKLPMFGCTDAIQVIQEVEEAKKEYPTAHVRIIGFDNVRQVQIISFVAYEPPTD